LTTQPLFEIDRLLCSPEYVNRLCSLPQHNNKLCVNRLKGLERAADESVNLEDILPKRQNCFGDANNEEAFDPTRGFCVYLHRKGYRYCRSDNRRFAGKGDFVW
jgi:hypothetical protein